jgi:hypothetical protein
MSIPSKRPTGVEIGLRPHCRWIQGQWALTPILKVLS